MVKLSNQSGPAAGRKFIRLALFCIAINFLLAALKLITGIISSSYAMLADAVNTASDIAVITLLLSGSVKLEKKQASASDNGKERSGSAAAAPAVLAAVLLLAGAFIAYRVISGIISGINGTLDAPGIPALIAAFVSVAVKELLYRITRRTAIKLHSNAVQADAWDHRRDALTSAGGFLAILGARLGFPMLDPIAGAVVCILIFKVAADVLLDAIDKAKAGFNEETAGEIRRLLLSCKDELGLKEARTRFYNARLIIDIDVISGEEDDEGRARAAAEDVHELISVNFPRLRQYAVHVNPAPQD